MNKNVLVSIDWKEKEKVYVRYQEASALARMEEANETDNIYEIMEFSIGHQTKITVIPKRQGNNEVSHTVA